MKILFYLDALTYMRGLEGGVRRYAEELKRVLACNGHHHGIMRFVTGCSAIRYRPHFSSFTPNIRFSNFIVDRIPTVLSPIYDPVKFSL